MKKKIRIIAYMAVICLLISACGGQQKVDVDRGFSLFYLNTELDKLETSPYTPVSDETRAIVADLIDKVDEVPDSSMVSLLPDGIRILGYNMDGTTLTVDFSRGYPAIPVNREVLLRGGLVREFLQVAGVERVRFTVEGDALKDSFGNEIGTMTNESFVENSASTINAYQSATMTLYFTDSEGKRLLPESRKVYYISSEPLERAVLAEIEKGPRLVDHYATFGPDNNVLSVMTQEDTCYVNLDSNGTLSTLDVSEEVQIYSIVNSLVDTCGVKKVQFSIDGNSTSVFRDNMSLAEPYTRNDSLIDRS